MDRQFRKLFYGFGFIMAVISLIIIYRTAHGNNEELIDNWTTKFDKILGTTQSVPIGHLYNFGGFTDGDRAMFFAIALGCEEMVLAGMDFGTTVTKYSRPNIEGATGPADEIKTKKLIAGLGVESDMRKSSTQ